MTFKIYSVSDLLLLKSFFLFKTAFIPDVDIFNMSCKAKKMKIDSIETLVTKVMILKASM